MKTDHQVDLLIIGGGINGTGIAAEAAARGLSVILCEQNDLASATSSASTKLIHGGLRYLAQYDFKLVHEALKEREILLKKAPHLIQPLAFILPYKKQWKPPWFLQLGLFIYDHLASNNTLPRSQKLDLTALPVGGPLNSNNKIGFRYYDCRCDDARLVIANAQAAAQHRAMILPHTLCTTARPQDNQWLVELLDEKTKKNITVLAKTIVNASGPWVNLTLQNVFQLASNYKVHLVKGSHIVVPRLYDGDWAYIFQTDDERVVFAIPYFHDFTLIGTTDVNYHQDPSQVNITTKEINYLCQVINSYFKKQISPDQIKWSYSGVRPLYGKQYANPSRISRDFYLELSEQQHPPLLSVFGGKITTFRTLAVHAVDKLIKYFPRSSASTSETSFLPGGDLKSLSLSDFTTHVQQQFPQLPPSLIQRYVHSYGSLTATILKHVTTLNDLGEHFGYDLYALEVDYLVNHEWAQTAEDILWRRSKLGLFINETEKQRLDLYLQ